MKRRFSIFAVLCVTLALGIAFFTSRDREAGTSESDDVRRGTRSGFLASLFGRGTVEEDISSHPSSSKEDAAAIRGRCVDAIDRHSIAGARVTLLKGLEEVGETLTDDDGHFRFVDAPKAYALRVNAPGYEVFASRFDPSADLTLELEKAAIVSGTVLDPAGLPVANAEVWAADFNRRSNWPKHESSKVITGPDGRFLLSDCPPGNLSVHVEHATYSDGSKYLGGVAAAARRDDVTIEIGPAALIAGVALDQSGAPVAGADVQWRESLRKWYEVEESTTTDAEGKFSLHVASAKKGVVFVSSKTAGDGFVEVAADPDHESHVEVRLRSPAPISGTVVDSAGGPIAAAQVEATGLRADHSRAAAETVSDAQGRFSLQVAASDLIQLEAVSPSGIAKANAKPGAKDVVLRIEAVGRLRYRLEGTDGKEPGRVSIYGRTADGRMLDFDRKAPPVRLEAVLVGPPGEWTLNIQRSGEGALEQRVVTVPAAPPETLLILPVAADAPRALLRGKIADPDGKAVAGARISIARAMYADKPENRSGALQWDSSVLSNRAGRFELRAPGGARRLFVFHPDFQSEVVDVQVPVMGDGDAGVIVLESGPSSDAIVEGVGIGITITTATEDEKGCSILGVWHGEPADRAGLKRGDVLLEANGISLVGAPFSECRTSLGGPEGTSIRLKLQRAEAEPFEVELVSERIRQ